MTKFCPRPCPLMENLDKGITVPKWVLIIWAKLPQMPQNLSAQFVCPSPSVLDFNEKRLHWVSVVRALIYGQKVSIPDIVISVLNSCLVLKNETVNQIMHREAIKILLNSKKWNVVVWIDFLDRVRSTFNKMAGFKGSSYINILTYIVFTIVPVIMFATIMSKHF